ENVFASLGGANRPLLVEAVRQWDVNRVHVARVQDVGVTAGAPGAKLAGGRGGAGRIARADDRDRVARTCYARQHPAVDAGGAQDAPTERTRHVSPCKW